jgi:hypothetical protein
MPIDSFIDKNWSIFTVFDKTGLPQFHPTTGFGKQNKKIKI